jgi:hypothetical protein
MWVDVPLMTDRTSFPLATSMHVFPLLSRRVSSMSSCSRSKLTTSARPSEAARWSAVVPDAGGWIALGEIDLWQSKSETVSAANE